MPDMTPEELTEERNKLGLTQLQFSKKLGCSLRFLAYRESGERRIGKMLEYASKWLNHY